MRSMKRRSSLSRRFAGKLGLPIAIMLDTKGPEYRIRTFASGKVTIARRQRFYLHHR